MLAPESGFVHITQRTAFRVIPLSLYKPNRPESIVAQVEDYIAPRIPANWVVDDDDAGIASSHSQFALDEASMFSDGSFPIAYFCSTAHAALDEFGERIIDLIVYGAGNCRAMMEVVVVETIVSGRLLDISGDKESEYLDPLEDWQAFGKLVRADEELDGLMFSGSVYEDNDPVWYATFKPKTVERAKTSPQIYQLTWDNGEFQGFKKKQLS